MRALLGALALALLVPGAPAATAAVAARQRPRTPTAAAKQQTAERKALPGLQVRRQVTGLELPWDVQPIGGGRLLITERDSAPPADPGGRQHQAGRSSPADKVWVSGETGLMSLEVDPSFATQRPLLHLPGWQKRGGGHDVRVIAWRLNDAGTRARFVRDAGRGFPTSTRSARRLPAADPEQRRPAGRHRRRGAEHQPAQPQVAGRQDAAAEPDDRHSRGRPTRSSTPTTRNKRYIHTYGHRNVQGLAQRARRHAVVGRARARHRGRGQPARRNGARLRLAPGARLQRGRADDRPVAARPAVQRALELRARRRPRRVRPGSGAASGARYNGTLAVACLRATG